MKLNIDYSIKRFKVPSKSKPNTLYLVEVMKSGDVFCQCHAGFSQKILCWHRKLIIEKLEKKEI